VSIPLRAHRFLCDAMKSFKPKYPNYKSVTGCLLVCEAEEMAVEAEGEEKGAALSFVPIIAFVRATKEKLAFFNMFLALFSFQRQSG
jgi:hypothetical protein